MLTDPAGNQNFSVEKLKLGWSELEQEVCSSNKLYQATNHSTNDEKHLEVEI